MAGYRDDAAELEKARIAAASHEKVAETQAGGTVAAAREHSAGQMGAAGVTQAGLRKMQEEKLAQEVMETRTKGLGDPGTSWGGQGPINLAAVRKGAGVVPAGAGPEAGTREQLGGGLEAMGEGTFNRPAHRDVVGAEGGGPVQVIRGMKSTFAGGAPGEEFQDLGAARQAINRAAGVGEFTSPEEAKYIAEAKRKPFEAKKAEIMDRQMGQDVLRQRMLGEPGLTIPDPGDPTKRIMIPELETLFNKHASGIRTADDVDKAWGEIAPHVETYKTLYQLKDQTTKNGMMQQANEHFKQLPPEKRPLTPSGQPMTDEAFKAYTDKLPLTPESVAWLNKYGGLSSKGSPQVTKPGTGGAVPLPPGWTPAAAAPAAAPRQPIMAAETPLADYAPAGGSAASTVKPAAVVTPGAEAGNYRADYENMEKLRAVMAKPIQDRGPEDIAYLQSLGPDYNIQANLALHKMRGFFRISPNEYDERLANMRKLYEPGGAR